VTFPDVGTGITISASCGKWDLSGYVAVAVDVHNVSTRPVTLIGDLNGQSWHNSFLHVEAGQRDTMPDGVSAILWTMRSSGRAG